MVRVAPVETIRWVSYPPSSRKMRSASMPRIAPLAPLMPTTTRFFVFLFPVMISLEDLVAGTAAAPALCGQPAFGMNMLISLPFQADPDHKNPCRQSFSGIAWAFFVDRGCRQGTGQG